VYNKLNAFRRVGECSHATICDTSMFIPGKHSVSCSHKVVLPSYDMILMSHTQDRNISLPKTVVPKLYDKYSPLGRSSLQLHLIISVLSIHQNCIRNFKVIIRFDYNIVYHYWSQKEENIRNSLRRI
jgi:hypothetical protein